MWQPIETAPKDQFLLLCGPSGYTTTPMVVTTGRMCSDYHAGRWIDHANDDLTDWGFKPTHWAPLILPGAQPAPSFADAYQGAMEDVAIWKKRALEAEDLNRKFVAAINGSAYMGEPAQPAPSIPEGVKKVTRGFYWNRDAQCSVPTLEVEFEPVPAGSPNNAKGWQDRDRLAAMLAAAPEAKP